MNTKVSFVLFGLLLVASEIKSDGSHAAAEAGTADTGAAPPNPPPGPAGVNPGLPGGVPAGAFPGGFLGYPGFGFSKSLNLNAGAGIGPAFLGGFGGGVPPPPVGGAPVDAGLGDVPPVGGFGGFGPSYLPSTWLGSALGAKGDFLFPCVIVIFFLVGVWTVIQFLLVLLVPFIGAKMGIANAIVGAKSRRSIEQDGCPCDVDTTQNITQAIDKGQAQYS